MLSRMAKKSSSGPVRYHNMCGLIRDLRKALDNGDEEAYEFGELVLEALDLIEDGGSGDATDDGSGATDGDTPEVDSRQQSLRLPGEGPAGRPTEGSAARSAPASILDRALDGLAGQERVQAQRELDELRMHSMGAPGVMEPPKENPRRGTRKA